MVFLWICWFSFTIYTSLMSPRLPWYEPCGMQFLAILVLSCPAMIGLGIGYFILARFMPMGRSIRILPFATSAALGALVFIDDSLGLGMQVAGTACCVLAALAAIDISIYDMVLKKKSEQCVAGYGAQGAPSPER